MWPHLVQQDNLKEQFDILGDILAYFLSYWELNEIDTTMMFLSTK